MNRRDALRLGLAGTTALIGNATIGGVAFAQDTAEPIVIDDKFLGAEDAPVTVIEYASFTCPHCARFHAEVFPQIKENYIDTGKVKFVYREVYFDRPGLWGGLLARCAGDTRYFGVVGMLYEKQREWLGNGSPGVIAENLRTIGRTVGMSDTEMDACFTDADTAQAMLAHYEETATADGLEGTPSFVVDGKLYSNMSYPDFAALLDEKLAG